MDVSLIMIVLAVIAAVVVLSLVQQRRFPGSRGSEPGEGDHVLESDYQSGMGGGHVTRWTVPRDPQEYAKRFVPKEKKK